MSDYKPYLMEGGDGQPRQRDERFPDIMMLRPTNLDYLRLRRALPASRVGYTTWLLAIFFFAFSLMIASSPPKEDDSGFQRFGVTEIIMEIARANPGLVIGISLVIVIVCVLVIVGDFWVRIHLARTGIVLLGQVLEAKGEEGERSIFTFFRKHYEVEVKYRVKLPDGHTIEATETARRDDWSESSLPRRGQTMVVLYSNIVIFTLL